MNVNRSGYYKWLSRPINQYERNRNDLLFFIKEEHKKHPSYGYHDLAKVIRDNTGWIFSDNLCHKVCKYNGIKSKLKHYKYRKTGMEHDIYENIINRNWSTTAPLQKVVSDMTIISYQGKKYEWTFFLDVFNNSIICSSVSGIPGDPRPYFECRDQFIKIVKERGINGPVNFHTDQGAVYASKAFNEALINNNIIRSMSRAGTPRDNAVIESMNGWIKAQIYTDKWYLKYDTVYEMIDAYIQFYNYERPMYKLHYKSPAEYTIQQGFTLAF